MSINKYLVKKIILTILSILISIVFAYIAVNLFLSSEKPLFIGFLDFFKNIFRGFGPINNIQLQTSFNNSIELFWNYYAVSFGFLLVSFIIALFLGFIFGCISAYKNNTNIDSFFSIIIFALAAIPTFIIAPILLVIAEINDIPIMPVTISEYGFGFFILSYTFPVLLLSLTGLAFMAIVVKKATLIILSSDYILIMKASGLSSKSIFFKGVLKNLIAEISLYLMPLLLLLDSYSLIIERIFQIPGQSIILLSLFKIKEINTIMCLMFFKIIIFFSLNFFAELTYDFIRVDITKMYFSRIVLHYKKKKFFKKGVLNA